MKTRFVLFFLSMALVSAVQARAKTSLPDACGNDSVKFEVKTEKNPHAPVEPPAGKALVVFSYSGPYKWSPFSYIIPRYGIDGAWVGANNGESWFAVAVEPGEHRVCADIQSHELSDVGGFTAKAGEVYYFESQLSLTGGSAGTLLSAGVTPTGGMAPAAQVGGSPGSESFSLVRLSEDTGKSHVKAWKHSTWKTK
jgi:hypothetical protein